MLAKILITFISKKCICAGNHNVIIRISAPSLHSLYCFREIAFTIYFISNFHQQEEKFPVMKGLWIFHLYVSVLLYIFIGLNLVLSLFGLASLRYCRFKDALKNTNKLFVPAGFALLEPSSFTLGKICPPLRPKGHITQYLLKMIKKLSKLAQRLF